MRWPRRPRPCIDMDWFEVLETRGHIENGLVGHYQVTLKVGFRIVGS